MIMSCFREDSVTPLRLILRLHGFTSYPGSSPPQDGTANSIADWGSDRGRKNYYCQIHNAVNIGACLQSQAGCLDRDVGSK